MKVTKQAGKLDEKRTKDKTKRKLNANRYRRKDKNTMEKSTIQILSLAPAKIPLFSLEAQRAT